MKDRITRKGFCQSALGGTVLLLVQSCGLDGLDLSADADATDAAGCSSMIADNHGHVLGLAPADLDALAERNYNILGAAGHNHVVTLSVAQLRLLKSGAAVSTTSSVAELHQHTIVIRCV